jgi:basic amino acid/polyamine antiporter, APA family
MAEATGIIKDQVGRDSAPARVLSVWDASMITVGIVVGAGIFETPARVASIAGSTSLTIAAWVLGGLLSLIGALTYAELATTYPSTGGDYAFLTRAYGRHVSFLFAWARSTVICTGSIALLGFILGDYLTRLYDLGPYSSAIYAGIATLVLSAINLAGLKGSARMQNVLTAVEIGGVLLVAVAGFLAGPAPVPTEVVSEGGSAFGLAMVFVLLTYGGWNEAVYVSAEVRGGPRSIAYALVLSIAMITLLYVLFVLAVLYGLGLEGMKASQAVGIDVMQKAFGQEGGRLIGALVAVAALTSMNSTMLVGARSNYAAGKDWMLLSFMARWRDENNTPVVGFLLQTVIALALIVFGAFEKDGFSTMVEFTSPVFWFFFMLSGIALFVLRSRDTQTPRPFRVPLYPVVPAIFVVTCAYLFYSSVSYARSQNAGYVALVVMATGLVVWLIVRSRGEGAGAATRKGA